MATQKPISTISYNTEPFLKEKLDSWVESHIIQTYQYIAHKGEDGDKDHIHLRIEPNKRIDQMDLTDALQEFPFGSDKPLGVRPWRESKEEDWFLYVTHDEEYLKLKYGGGEKGEKIPYDFTQIVVPDSYDLEVAWIRAKASLKHSSVNIATRIQNGENPLNVVLEGNNPYLVNTLMRLVSLNDYQRLQEDYNNLYREHNLIIHAINKAGLIVQEAEDGSLFLVPGLPDNNSIPGQS